MARPARFPSRTGPGGCVLRSRPWLSSPPKALRFQPFVVCEIGLYARAGKQFLRVEVHFPVQRLSRGARILDSFLARPLYYGDEVEFAGTRGLLQHEILQETWLRFQERVGPPGFVQKLVPRAVGNCEFVLPIDSFRHVISPLSFLSFIVVEIRLAECKLS